MARSLHRSPARRATRAGFTLLEILAVLVIIGLLASAVAVAVRSVMVRARINTTKGELAAIAHALEMYSLEHNGAYPPVGDGFAGLSRPSAEGAPPLLEKAAIDPWGHPYQYNAPGRDGKGYEVFSLGADGKEGGGDDIGSWDLERKVDTGGPRR